LSANIQSICNLHEYSKIKNIEKQHCEKQVNLKKSITFCLIVKKIVVSNAGYPETGTNRTTWDFEKYYNLAVSSSMCEDVQYAHRYEFYIKCEIYTHEDK
jgi:hypothetical protein